jgi:metal-sulfur cluster biosynthetic enzyme
MTTTSSAELRIDTPQLRLDSREGGHALSGILGQPLTGARTRLRLGPGRTCEPLARLLDRVIVEAEQAGLDPRRLVVADGSVEPDEDIVRVRRKAHGTADWIRSATSRVMLTLQPAGLYEIDTDRPAGADPAASAAGKAAAEPAPRAGVAAAAGEDDPRALAVRDALFDVLDPDLGVNIVDLGFVRGLRVEARTAIITMTLTSAACPLTRVMEDQMRTELAGIPGVDDFRIDWVWLPAWQPGDITDSGRDQLQAIGFTV